MLKRIINGINFVTRLSGIFAGLILTALMLLNTYAVILRYLFNSPVDWILDVSELCMVASVFIGAAYILHIDGHVRVDLIVNRLSEKTRRYLNLITMTFVFIFTGILSWKSWELAWENLYTRSDSVVQLPLFPGYIVVFYGSLLLFLQSMIKIQTSIKRI